MANNCFYDMRITGRKKNIEELIRMMQWEGEYINDGLGRIFSCEITDEVPLELAEANDVISIDVCGDCAWSVNSAMRVSNRRPYSLESEAKRLNLVVEVYSSEPGIGFQEHVLIDRGDVLIEDCVDYEEHWVQEYDTIEDYNAEYDTNFTEDMVNDNGDICIGGFGDAYGVFEHFTAEHFN